MNHQAIKMDDKVIGIYDKDSNNLAYFHSDTPDSPFSNLYQPKNGFNLYAYNGKMQVAPAKGILVMIANLVINLISNY